MKLRASEVPKTPKHYRLLPALFIGYPLEPHSKVLLLKASYIRVKDHASLNLVLTWKHRYYWLAFIVPEDAKRATGLEKSLSVLPTCEPYER